MSAKNQRYETRIFVGEIGEHRRGCRRRRHGRAARVVLRIGLARDGKRVGVGGEQPASYRQGIHGVRRVVVVRQRGAAVRPPDDALHHARPARRQLSLALPLHNPVNCIDPTGGWNVRVSASSDRGKHPYATFTAYDRNDNIIFSTIVKVRGDGRIRSERKHDTPQGTYKILEWRETGNDRYSAVKYGPNDLLALDYQSGEGEGRNYMHVHGGRSQGPELTDTWGCLRMADQDIKELKQVVDFVESSDPNESPGYLTVKDDIPAPVSFSDRDAMKFSIFRHVRLDEVVCIGQKLPMPESRRPSIVDIVKPVTNPSIK